MAGFVYARVSRTEQAVNGHSLPDQVRQGLADLSTRGITPSVTSNMDCPGAYVDPGVSAWKIRTTDRNGFSQMWAQAKSGDTIVIVSLDRMFRSVLDFAHMAQEFTKRGIALISLRENLSMDTASGRFMCHVAASFAQLKSDLISERKKESVAWNKRSKEDRQFLKGVALSARHIPAEVKKEASPVHEMDELTRELVLMRTGETIQQALTRIQNQNLTSTASAKVKPGAKVWGYLRVSSLDQSVDSQRIPVARVMERMVAETGIEAAEVVADEGVSAYSKGFLKREGGQRLVRLMKDGDHLVISRIDRMFRSVRDMMNVIDALTARGIVVHAADAGWRTDTAEGRRFIDLMAMMAEWESREIGWRTKMTHRYLAIMSGDPIIRTWNPKKMRRWKVVKKNGKYNRIVNKKYCFKLMTAIELSKRIGPLSACYLLAAHESIQECRYPVTPVLAYQSSSTEMRKEKEELILIASKNLSYSKRAQLASIAALDTSIQIRTLIWNNRKKFPDLLRKMEPQLCEDAVKEAEYIVNVYIDADDLTHPSLCRVVKRFFLECQSINFEDPLSEIPSLDKLATQMNLNRVRQPVSKS